MDLSAAFEERVRQMEDDRNHRLSLLHAEKELQAAQSRRRHRLPRPCCARRLAVARDLSSVRGEIEEAGRREDKWDSFSEAERKEMEEFQAASQRFEAEARKEVQRLRGLVSQLKSTLQELHGSGMYSNNAEIAAAEARKSDLTARKAKLDESLALARQFRELQEQLQKAFASQVGDQKAAPRFQNPEQEEILAGGW